MFVEEVRTEEKRGGTKWKDTTGQAGVAQYGAPQQTTRYKTTKRHCIIE